MTHKEQKGLTSRLAEDYHGQSLCELGKEYNIHPLAVRRYLLTAGVYTAVKTKPLLNAPAVARKAAVERITDFESLWRAIIVFEGYEFYTAKGLPFRYKVKGGELFVDRKEKSITASSVRMCYDKAVNMRGIVPGPKKLGVFGASYLYPVLMRLGVIRKNDM